MTTGALVVAVLLLLALARGASPRATPEQMASARAIAAARLQQFADEREERFRQYHLAWGVVGRRLGQRVVADGYVLEFPRKVSHG